MAAQSFKRRCIDAIKEHGALLVFAMKDRKDPASLWSALWPRSKMRWEWDENGDDRVAQLWHIREELSKSGQVVYAKWYRGRATFFAKDVFTAILSVRGEAQREGFGLTRRAREILDILEMNSPMSSKELKKEVGLTGKFLSPDFDRAMKELWSRFLIVGYGEFDDGAFPSLAIGSTKLLHEDLWLKALALDPAVAHKNLEKRLGKDTEFFKFFAKEQKKLMTEMQPA